MSFVKIGTATAVVHPHSAIDRPVARRYNVGTYDGTLAIIFAPSSIMAAVEVKPDHPLMLACTLAELERTTSRFYLTHIVGDKGGVRHIKKLSYADVRTPENMQMTFVTEAIATRFALNMYMGLEDAPEGTLEVTLQTATRRDTMSIDYRFATSHLDEFVTHQHISYK